MSEKPCIEIPLPRHPGIRLFKWLGLGLNDTGYPLYLPQHSDKTIQVRGTFGTGGKCRIEGSNMDENPEYDLLTDQQESPLEISTSSPMKFVTQNPYMMRPNIVGGDGTTNLNIYLVIK